MKYIYVSVAMICSVSENGAFLLLASVAKLETNTFPICREVEFDIIEALNGSRVNWTVLGSISMVLFNKIQYDEKKNLVRKKYYGQMELFSSFPSSYYSFKVIAICILWYSIK